MIEVNIPYRNHDGYRCAVSTLMRRVRERREEVAFLREQKQTVRVRNQLALRAGALDYDARQLVLLTNAN